jgi:Uma2 family endonuclease
MALPENLMTPQAYLEFERASEIKHEYFEGEVFAMSGASRNHNRIVISVGASLYAQLRQSPCEVFPSDMRVKAHSGLYTYPDISAACSEPQFEDTAVDTLLNPILIIEVLSPSTERYDRGRKFQHYRHIPSMQEYVLIAQDSCHVERYVRRPNNEWVLSETADINSALELTSIQCRLALADIYENVTFEGHGS